MKPKGSMGAYLAIAFGHNINPPAMVKIYNYTSRDEN